MSKDANGYRAFEGKGCTIRADVVDVYVFAREEGTTRFLQLLRAREPLAKTWHPVMGHCEAGETAVECAVRELSEEIGLDARSGEALGFWALEQTYPFFIHQIDTVVLSPRFAIEVVPAFAPALNDEHTASRWVRAEDADSMFLWPGQRTAVQEILREFVQRDSETSARLRIDLD